MLDWKKYLTPTKHWKWNCFMPPWFTLLRLSWTKQVQLAMRWNLWQNMPLSGFEPVTQWSEVQHATSLDYCTHPKHWKTRSYFNNVLWEKCCAIKFENSGFGHCLLIQTDLWNYNLQPSYILCRSNFMFQSLKIKSYYMYGHFLTIIPVLTKFTETSDPVFDHFFHQFEKIKFWLTGH